MGPPSHRTLLHVLAKTCWLVGLIGTAGLATLGMGTGFLSFDPTEILTTQRSAERLLTASGLLFLGLAVIARLSFEARGWPLLVLTGVASGCFLLTTTDLRFVAVLFLWPLVIAAAGGVLSQPKSAVAMTRK
jgi:hypothetical protein